MLENLLLTDLQNSRPDIGQAAAAAAAGDSADRATVLNLMNNSLATELLSVQRYRRQHSMIVQYLGNDDPSTRRMMEGLVAMEERHAELIRSFTLKLNAHLGVARARPVEADASGGLAANSI